MPFSCKAFTAFSLVSQADPVNSKDRDRAGRESSCMSNIRVGTASWSDKSLIDSGLYYPSEAKSPEQRLRFYAAHFPIVELDSSYYGIPTETSARQWAERTPEGFKFNVKAFRIFTGHQTPPAAIPPDIRAQLPQSEKKNVYYKDVPVELRDELWKRFADALLPLRQAAKLGAIHFQFPPWLVYNRDSLAHVLECRERMPLDLLATEFRSASWFNERHREHTLAFQRDHGLTHVVVDEPQGFKSSVPLVWAATNPELAVVRLHGRNAETWEKKGLQVASDRFNYDYSDEELAAMVDPVRQLAHQVTETYVIFNNNYSDQGPRNASTLRRLLD
jgi:uncharacterized protein YecE (DUF72 family)